MLADMIDNPTAAGKLFGEIRQAGNLTSELAGGVKAEQGGGAAKAVVQFAGGVSDKVLCDLIERVSRFSFRLAARRS